MKVILKNLTPEECEFVIDWYLDENIDISTNDFSLSSFPNDLHYDKNVNVVEFINSYLKGEKSYSLINSLSNFSSDNLSEIQYLDLAYRVSHSDLNKLLIPQYLENFINYRRAFMIAWNENSQAIIDLFIERHPTAWFKPLIQICPAIGEYLSKGIEPTVHISNDGSAKQIGQHFYIHAGTNDWNKAWLSSCHWDAQWEKQLIIWQNQFKKTENSFLKLELLDFTFLIVPEKDAIARVVNRDYENSNHLPYLFIQRLPDKLQSNNVFYPLIELIALKDDVRFKLPDSHLSALDYWTIFLGIIQKWGFIKESEVLKCKFEFIANYGDLGSKFEKFDGQRQTLTICEPELGKPEVIDGSEEFCNPLRDCYVKWQNKKPLIDKSVLILGDSHCSIGGSPFLSYLFANVFSEVTFYWNPYYLNALELSSNENYDFALSEISQRFVNPTLK